MAVISDIEIRLRADIARLQQDLTRARQQVSGFTDGVQNLVKGMFAGFSIAAVISQVVSAQREFDKLHSSLVTATGSITSANEAFASLQRFAASTPYSLQEVTEGFLKLRNLGLTPSERALMSYGNTAAAMGKSLEQLVEAVADATTGEFERLKEFGIKAKQQGDQVALTFQGTTTKIGNNSAEIEAYLLAIGEVNFAGGMERQAATLDGALSNLGDTFQQTLIAFSQSGFGDVVMGSVLALSGALQDLGEMFKAVRSAADSEGQKVEEIAPLHLALTTIFEAVVALGVNVSYVLKTIGKDIGAVVAAAEALARGDIASWKRIGEMRRAEAEEERREVDETTERILGAATKGREQREKEAEERRNNTIDALSQYKILTKANQEYFTELKRLQSDFASGKLKEADYIAQVSELAKKSYAAQMAEANQLSDAQIKEAEKRAKAEKQRRDSYLEMQSAIDMQVASTAREAAGLDALAEGQKKNIELTDKIKRGKVQVTPVEEAALRRAYAQLDVNKAAIKSQEDYRDSQKRLQDQEKENLKIRTDAIDKASEEAEKNELLAKTFGMTEAAIAALEVARLKEQLAQRSNLGLTLDEIEHLESLIELKERSAKAVADRAELEKTKEFWTNIEKTAHDTFVSITDGGKNAFQRLKDTAKNTFFDWLYQQTLKKWVINIGTSVAGTGAVSGIAQAAGAAGGGVGEAFSLAGAANSLYGSLTGGATLAGGLGTGFLGSLAGGLEGLVGASATRMGLTSSLGVNIGNSIASVVGPNVASGIATGLSGLAAAAPWVAGALAVYTIGKKAFGRGPKEFTGDSTLSGTIGTGGLNASILNDWVKKGGWFRSDKRGTDSSAVDAELASGIAATYEAIKASSADYARALGLNAESIANRSQAISIAFGKDEAANQKAIADFFSGVADSVAREVLPDIARFQQQGETVSSTLQRVATNFQAVEVIFDGMGVDAASAFRAVGTASIEARERLLAFAGGIDALASQSAFFTQNFLSQAEQIAIIQKPLAAQLEALGYAGITTADQFKEAVQGLVNSGALATEQGARTYAGLLALGPAFKTVADYLKELADTAAETMAQEAAAKLAEEQRAQAEAADAAADALRNNLDVMDRWVDSAMSALSRAVGAQKELVTAAYQEAMASLEGQIGVVNATIARTGELTKLLQGSLIRAPGDATAGGSRLAAEEQIRTALTIARASGMLPDADSLRAALSTVNQDATDQFSSLLDYQRSVARTNADIAALGGISEGQLSIAELQLQALQAQRDQAKTAYDAEIRRLDMILTAAEDELNAIRGVDTSIKSVERATLDLKAALLGLKTTATPSNPNGIGSPSSGPISVEDLYRRVLGREAEAGGLAFWKRAFGDTVDATEMASDAYRMFLQGAAQELLQRNNQPPIVPDTMGAGTMASNLEMSSEQRAINERMEQQMQRIATATEQFANQFNQVSGGGNTLLVESA